MTKTGTAARPPIEDHAETFLEWTESHARALSYGAVALAVVAGLAAMYARSSTAKQAQAEKAYFEAQRSVIAGNLPLAQSDLQKVALRFAGTSAGVQATLVLAQVMYDQNKFAEGMKALEKVEGQREAKVFASSIQSLMAAGLESQAKFKEAAERYRKAADLSAFKTDKALLLAQAARAYMSAQDSKSATDLWTKLAEDPDGPVAGEARIRLGELAVR